MARSASSGYAKARKAMMSLQAGTYAAGGEIIDWPYYDSFLVAAAVLVHQLFTRSVGVGGARLDQTNMTEAGRIPANCHFAVYAIKVYYTSDAAQATVDVQSLYTLLATTTVEFMIPGKDSLLTCTAQDLMGSASLFAVTPTAAGDNIPLIQPRFHGVYPLNEPIVLAGNTNFRLQVTHQVAPAAGLADNIFRIALQGILRRAS